MKKTFTANLNGTVFHIEEDAYDQLQRYLANIRAKFSGSNEAEEIMADIEARIAELFNERLQGRQAVSMADVDHVKQVMGQPEDYVEDEPSGSGPGKEGGAWQQAGTRKHKRLFRDPDDKKIAGVLSGLGHYFGLDPLWLRIIALIFLFAGWGSPALIYLVLWMLVPEANTAAEKLEMQGEPVTVDNIKRMFDEGAEQFKAGATRMAGEAKEMGRKYWQQGAGDRHAFRSRAESAGHQVFSVFGKLVGFVFLITAILLLLGLFAGIVGGSVGSWQATWTNEHLGILDLGSHLFNSRAHALWFTIGVVILVIIPIVGLFMAGFRLLTGTLAPRWLVWSLSTLWVLAFVPVIWASVSLAKDFGRENSVRTELTLAQPASGTLSLDMLAPSGPDAGGWSINYDHGSLDVDLGGIHLDKGIISGAWATVDIEASNDSLFHLVVIREAHAGTAKVALARSEHIQYTFKQEGDVLSLSPVVSYRVEDKIRGQEARFILQVPLGGSVFLRKSSRPLLDDIANTTNTYDGDMVGHRWTMTLDGLTLGHGEMAPDTSTVPAAPATPKSPGANFRSEVQHGSGTAAKVASMEMPSVAMPGLISFLTAGLRP
jgi:phage shock protein PspC (stress-responsive transcriptional regulator)